ARIFRVAYPKNDNAKIVSGCLKWLIYLNDKGIATPCIARLAMTVFYFRQPEKTGTNNLWQKSKRNLCAVNVAVCRPSGKASVRIVMSGIHLPKKPL
ncbi:MAG: hypothetical protein IIU35_03770, partial [Neisseriaceae bacterium]|nr:hypothetical protein [Neisseriaceae bacterium]